MNKWWVRLSHDIRSAQIEDPVFFFQGVRFGGTPDPARAPVAYQPPEAVAIETQRRCEADEQIPECHFVLVSILVKKTEVTGDREQKVIVPRRKLRQNVLYFIGCFLLTRIFGRQLILCRSREDVFGQISQPCLEK